MITANEARKNSEEYITAEKAKRAKRIQELVGEVGKNIEATSKRGYTQCDVNLPNNFYEEVCAELTKLGFTVVRYACSTAVIRWD
jgi:hypothetical protein